MNASFSYSFNPMCGSAISSSGAVGNDNADADKANNFADNAAADVK